MRARPFPANDRQGWLVAVATVVMAMPAFAPTAPPEPAPFLASGAFEDSASGAWSIHPASTGQDVLAHDRGGHSYRPSLPEWREAELSWYDGYRLTASGERFDRSSRTVAVMYRAGTNRPRLPFGTVVEIRVVGRNGSVLSTSRARVNNTGSYRPKQSDWWFDGTPMVFRSHAPLKRGRIIVQWRVVD